VFSTRELQSAVNSRRQSSKGAQAYPSGVHSQCPCVGDVYVLFIFGDKTMKIKNKFQNLLLQEDLNFLVTNRIPRITLTRFMGWWSQLRNPWVVKGSIAVWRWFTDLDFIKTNYTSFPECQCEVHYGFYYTTQRIINDVLTAIKYLKNIFPDYSIFVTAHSLGGSIALLTSMDLIKAGYDDVSIYNFGQPRVGNKDFSNFVNSKIQTWRIVHTADIVPHLPAEIQGFYHVCNEIFEDKLGNLKLCDISCEDPTCSNKYNTNELNVDDHMTYLNITMGCDNLSL
jgi:hypothetical protein